MIGFNFFSSMCLNSSYNFSPGLKPVYIIGISFSGSNPERRIKSLAILSILIGHPYLKEIFHHLCQELQIVKLIEMPPELT